MLMKINSLAWINKKITTFHLCIKYFNTFVCKLVILPMLFYKNLIHLK